MPRDMIAQKYYLGENKKAIAGGVWCVFIKRSIFLENGGFNIEHFTTIAVSYTHLGNQDATYNAEMEASPSISDGGAEPRSADAVPSDEQLDLGQNPETGTVISEDAKIVIGQELENAFRDPENNKGTNLKEIEMTVYGVSLIHI